MLVGSLGVAGLVFRALLSVDARLYGVRADGQRPGRAHDGLEAGDGGVAAAHGAQDWEVGLRKAQASQGL